jgi:hypothetical protein
VLPALEDDGLHGVEDVPEPPHLGLGRLAGEERRVLEQGRDDQLRTVLREPPRDDAAERAPDDDGAVHGDRGQHRGGVGAVTGQEVGARRVVGAPVAPLVDADDPPAPDELVGKPFPRPAARADPVQEQHRRPVLRPLELDVEADAVVLDPSRRGHGRRIQG